MGSQYVPCPAPGGLGEECPAQDKPVPGELPPPHLLGSAKAGEQTGDRIQSGWGWGEREVLVGMVRRLVTGAGRGAPAGKV